MIVPIYPLALGGWTFREQPWEPVLVQVPDGSVVREAKSIGAVLFVPSPADRRQLMAWFPLAVLAETKKKNGRFRTLEAVPV